MRVTAIGALAALLGLGAVAQAETSGSAPGCVAAKADPATPPAKGEASGTAPGGSGSSGWSGGTGGSYVGTTPAGASPASPSFQPATAKGLDPIKGLAQPAAAKC